ncbi:MAG: hypothetical protein RLZZ519_1031 [Bacteroidota bacterium]|jgi:hypothetical protein
MGGILLDLMRFRSGEIVQLEALEQKNPTQVPGT